MTRTEKEEALVLAGFLTPAKVSEIPDQLIEVAHLELIEKKQEALDLKSEFPLGTVREFKQLDGSTKTGDLVDYNGNNAVFQIREPELLEMNIEQLRQTKPK